MKLEEVKNFIIQSNEKDWFENAEFTFTFLCSTGSLKKTGLLSIYKFILEQINTYKSYGKELPTILNPSLDYFTKLQGEIIAIIKSHNSYRPSFEAAWKNLGQSGRNSKVALISSNSPEVAFLIELNRDFPRMVSGAFSYISGQEIPKDKQGFAGAIKAYEFSLDGDSKISRSRTERASYTKLVKKFEEAIDLSDKTLLNHITNSKSLTEEFSSQIDTLKIEKEEMFGKWFNNSKTEFKGLSEKIDLRRNELEELYKDHLALDAPADYWKKRSDELYVQGHKYLFWLYWFIGLSGISLFFILWQIPDGIFLNIFKGEASAIKWTFVYISFLTLIGFGIKTLSKIAYSTFHLMRDAEERYQLTHVYLALKNDSSVELEDRQLILQSLFSRADSGLLREDSSPTMPGILDTVFKSNR